MLDKNIILFVNTDNSDAAAATGLPYEVVNLENSRLYENWN